MFENASLDPPEPGLRWRTVTVAAGGQIVGILCGELRAVECHWVNECSKPCRHKITKGRVPCYCSDEPNSLRTIAYVPIETRDREQLVVIVPKTTARAVATFKQGEVLEFTRAKRDKSPARVRVTLPEQIGAQRCAVVAAEKPRDISRYLLHMWGDVVLQKFFETTTTPPENVGPNLMRKPRETTRSKTVAALPSKRDQVNAILCGIGQTEDKR